MFQRTFHLMEREADKGRIPEGTAFRLALAVCLEAAAAGFHKSFYGDKEWSAAHESIRKTEKDGEELVGTMTEAFLSDISSTRRLIKTHLGESAALASTDFALCLANVRQKVIREGYTYSDSMLANIATPLPVSDFRLVEGVTFTNFDDLEEQPEATDVTFGRITYTEDGFRVSLKSKAVKFTYQMWKNDTFGLVLNIMKKGGEAARRARHLVVADAIIAGVPVSALAAGGPTIEKLEAVINQQAALKDADGRATPRRVTDLLLPLAWQTTANVALNSQQVFRTGDKQPTANPVLNAATPHVDDIWSEKAGKKWLAYDGKRELVTLGVLDDFQGGPRTVTKLPDVGEFPEAGAFSDNTIQVKWMDAVGAKVTPEGAKNGTIINGE